MSDHTDMMLNRAIASADFDAYREDAKDDRIAALEAENAALKAELEIARHTHSESWKYVVSRAEKSEAQVDALTAELNAKSEQLTALSGHLEAMINANQRVRAEREEASACAEAALDAKTDEAATLRAALKRVEWVEHDGWHLCAWCGSEDWEGHAPDCAWQAALSQTAQTSEVKA